MIEPSPASRPPSSSAAASHLATRRALAVDAPEIHRLIGVCSEMGFMLPRTLGQIYETLQEWVVAVDETQGKVVGCAALHVDHALLAEIRSVAVDPGCQGKGIGRLLVDAQVEEALRLGIKNCFVLTDKPEYFKKLGFHEIDMADLPRKIWRDCVNCPVFPECRETALLRPTEPSERPLY